MLPTKTVTTKIVWDADGNVLEHESFEYGGEFALAKGEDTAKKQLELQNRLVQEQLAQQTALFNLLKSNTEEDLKGNRGFSPEQLAVMTSMFQDENANAFNAAGSNVRSSLASRGSGLGDLPVGGDFTRGIAELEGAKAGSQSQGLLGIRMQNAMQALANKWNAANVLSGNAATMGGNIGYFNAGAGNALEQYIEAKNPKGGFMTALGGGLGEGLGKGISGGLGKLISPSKKDSGSSGGG